MAVESDLFLSVRLLTVFFSIESGFWLAKPCFQSSFQQFQAPKLEVPTIYKAEVNLRRFRAGPNFYGLILNPSILGVLSRVECISEFALICIDMDLAMAQNSGTK